MTRKRYLDAKELFLSERSSPDPESPLLITIIVTFHAICLANSAALTTNPISIRFPRRYTYNSHCQTIA